MKPPGKARKRNRKAQEHRIANPCQKRPQETTIINQRCIPKYNLKEKKNKFKKKREEAMKGIYEEKASMHEKKYWLSSNHQNKPLSSCPAVDYPTKGLSASTPSWSTSWLRVFFSILVRTSTPPLCFTASIARHPISPEAAQVRLRTHVTPR